MFFWQNQWDQLQKEQTQAFDSATIKHKGHALCDAMRKAMQICTRTLSRPQADVASKQTYPEDAVIINILFRDAIIDQDVGLDPALGPPLIDNHAPLPDSTLLKPSQIKESRAR